MPFEYLVMPATVAATQKDDCQKALNHHGKEGWHIVTVVTGAQQPGYFWIIMEREAEAPKAR